MKLVIVESPAKAKTITKFLGKGYEVKASYGHVRDLPKSASEIPAAYKSLPWARLGVDVDNGFRAIYVVQKESHKHISELKKMLPLADEIILATDEDREGESISWHLLEVLKPKVPVKRIAFHEITREAIQEAMASPRPVNQSLVRAQETRRVLDRLFGYELSPVLWRRIRPKLSAGRVQSVALRLVVEREEERRAFVKSAYWDAEALISGQGREFKAALVLVNDKRIPSGKDFDASNGRLRPEVADAVALLSEKEAVAILEQARAHLPWVVHRVEEKEARVRPNPPFITSTLQQAAGGALGFSPKKTMQIAQRLYEGVDLGGGEREGLITYMRTDSVLLSEKALRDTEEYIRAHHGEKHHQRRQYSNKSKMAQEAHEAIRPTHVSRTPASVASDLSRDEYRLYELIWKRTVASQMADAIVKRTTVDLLAPLLRGSAVFRATGSVVVFPGFMLISDDKQKNGQLPPISEGMPVVNENSAAESPEVLRLRQITPVSHETQPPARYTEASLVKRLEEEGIGRPSTYAPTIAIIQQRGYVQTAGNALAPTYLGIAVIILLRKHFHEYVDLGFTARLEDCLDAIANDEEEWDAFLKRFYFGAPAQEIQGLKPLIDATLDRIEYPVIPVGRTSNDEPVVVRLGKSAPFLQRGEGGGGNVAPVPETVHYGDMTLDRALEILEARAQPDEPLSRCSETGEVILVLEGPYGPYVQLGEGKEKEKPKRVGLPKGLSKDQITPEQARYLLSLPQNLGTHPETGKEVAVGIGRFGPYVRHETDYRQLDAAKLFSVVLHDALALLAQPKAAGSSKQLLRSLGQHPESGSSVALFSGRYGPYVSDGRTNATLPRNTNPEAVSLEMALDLLKVAEERRNDPTYRRSSTAAKKPAARKRTPRER